MTTSSASSTPILTPNNQSPVAPVIQANNNNHHAGSLAIGPVAGTNLLNDLEDQTLNTVATQHPVTHLTVAQPTIAAGGAVVINQQPVGQVLITPQADQINVEVEQNNAQGVALVVEQNLPQNIHTTPVHLANGEALIIAQQTLVTPQHPIQLNPALGHNAPFHNAVQSDSSDDEGELPNFMNSFNIGTSYASSVASSISFSQDSLDLERTDLTLDAIVDQTVLTDNEQSFILNESAVHNNHDNDSIEDEHDNFVIHSNLNAALSNYQPAGNSLNDAFNNAMIEEGINLDSSDEESSISTSSHGTKRTFSEIDEGGNPDYDELLANIAEHGFIATSPVTTTSTVGTPPSTIERNGLGSVTPMSPHKLARTFDDEDGENQTPNNIIPTIPDSAASTSFKLVAEYIIDGEDLSGLGFNFNEE